MAVQKIILLTGVFFARASRIDRAGLYSAQDIKEEGSIYDSCATELVQDAARCGVDQVTNFVTDGARCGWTTCYQDIPWVGRQGFPCPKQCEQEEQRARSCSVKTSCRYRLRVWLEGVINAAHPAHANFTLNYVRTKLLDGSAEVKAIFAAEGAVDNILGDVVEKLEQEGNRKLGDLTNMLQGTIIELVSGQMQQLDDKLSGTLGGTDASLAMQKALRTVISESSSAVDDERLSEESGFGFTLPKVDTFDVNFHWWQKTTTSTTTTSTTTTEPLDFEVEENVTVSILLPQFRSNFTSELCNTTEDRFQCKFVWSVVKHIVWSNFPKSFLLPVPDGMPNVDKLEAHLSKDDDDEIITLEHLPWKSVMIWLRSVLLEYGKTLPVGQPLSIIDAHLKLIPVGDSLVLHPTSWIELDGSVNVGQ